MFTVQVKRGRCYRGHYLQRLVPAPVLFPQNMHARSLAYISSSHVTVFQPTRIQKKQEVCYKTLWVLFRLAAPLSQLSCPFVICLPFLFQIICWNTKTLKPIWSIPTLGGFVYSLATCPVDPGCVALGVGDNMIRVWNTSAAGKSYAVNILWQGIKSKVTVVSQGWCQSQFWAAGFLSGLFYTGPQAWGAASSFCVGSINSWPTNLAIFQFY